MSDMELRACDLYFTRGTTFMARAIRWATRESGEKRTEANHVGVIVDAGRLNEVTCIEALKKVRRHSFYRKYHGLRTKVQIWRPKNLTFHEKTVILNYLIIHVGDTYGWEKIGLHFLRKITGTKLWLRLSTLEKYPICSYLVARAFAEADKKFGVRARRATPDDMHDFVVKNPDKYELVLDWTRI